tara:strand:- start:529 stop:1839 length:1311 start_codon:yes stop_codon:yes gene_type:complete
MSEELTNMAQSIGCSPSFVEFNRLPVTFSQIALVAGLIITEPANQTGPHYDSQQRSRYDLCVETGEEGTAIIFNYPLGGTTGEIVFNQPKFRSKSRHIINANLQFSPGDFRPSVRNRHATLYIGDMGLQLSTTDESEMNQKYGQRALTRRRWGFNNRGNMSTMGYTVQTTGGIQIHYSWQKDEHVYGWNDSLDTHNRTTVIPFFGTSKPTRIKPIFEARFPYDTFKTMLNRAGRKKDSGGALYWSYNPKTKKLYTIGAYADGKVSKEGRNHSAPVWVTPNVTELLSGTIPYRPFGDAIVNRYKTATHAGFGIDEHGRQFMCVYYPWGHIRYNHITFMHGLIGDDSQHDGGNAKAAEQQSPIPYFENFDLTFEYSPYTAEEEKYLTKWYNVFNEFQEEQMSRPKLPKKGEILNWWICYCQNGEITVEDELLARKILS